MGFKSKRECEDYTRQLIKHLGCSTIKKEDANYLFFENLLRNHSDYESKRGLGIDYFYIQFNATSKTANQTMIQRIDGTNIDFSWVNCCQFRKRTDKENLVSAMRTAIKNVVIDYKKSQPKLICNMCKTEDEIYENYHVDHKEPPFRKIKDDFLINRQLPTAFESDKSNAKCFTSNDAEFEREWYEYHNRIATFQILCRHCNCKVKH